MTQTEEPVWRTKRREKIVFAAKRLFARTPFEQVQMDDLASAAKVSKATLYRYFPSKSDIYLEICERAFKGLAADIAEVSDLPPVEALYRVITALIDVLSGQVASLRLLSGERSPVAEGWRDLYQKERRAIVQVFRRILADGVARGQFRELDLDLVPSLLVGMVRGGLVLGAPSDRKYLADTMMDIVLNGALTPSARDRDGSGGRPAAKRNCLSRRAA